MGTLYKFKSTFIVIFAPILLLPIIIFSPQELYTEVACAYTILLMAVYWVTEVVPLAVTALLPLVLYPFLGVLPAAKVSVQYLKDVNVLFLGGLTVAVAVEHWNLHKRIALKVLTFVGAKPRWLLFGFMVTTAFLSMWISNVATTAMMIPIAQAVLSELNVESSSGKESDNTSADSGRSTPGEDEVSVMEAPRPSNVTAAEINPLVAEMGNIGQAQELASRLNSTGESSMAVSYSNSTVKPSYSDPPAYSSVATDDNYDPTIRNGQIEIHITMPDTPTPQPTPKRNHSSSHLMVKQNSDEGSEAPDSSTAQLIQPNERTFGIDIGDRIDREKRTVGLSKALTICVCYAANIGGTATLTGTGPNLIMAGQFKTTYSEAPEVDFGSWAFFSFPGMLIFLLFTWLWIEYLFLNPSLKEMFSCVKGSSKTFEERQAEDIIKRQYKDLGPMSFAEVSVLVLFILLALLWLTRDPGFVNGWGSLPIFRPKYVSDASVAMFITFILFVFPSKRPNFFCCRSKYDTSESGPVPPLLTWNIVHQKMAWNVILLLGGGFAMALGSKESGLSKWIGTQMTPLNALPPFSANLICCLVICALTQCTSNTATATVFLPILAELAEVLHVNPLYLMLPSTVITSYAFMLPVSTPPNAIAYSYGHLTMMDMIKAGSILNIIGIFMALFSVHVFGGPSFHVFDNCPSWLHTEYCSNITATTISPISNDTILTTISNLTVST